MFKIINFARVLLIRRWQKNLALSLVYSLVIAFYASVIFFTSSLKRETQLTLQNVPDLWVQKLAGGRLIPISEDFLDSLGQMRGVKRIIPRIWGYNFDTPTGAVLTIMGSDSLLNDLSLVEGKSQGKLSPDEVLLGKGLMELRGLELGEDLSLLDDQGEINIYTIVGSFRAESDLLTRDLIILAPVSARKMLGLKPGEVNDLALEVYNPQEVNNIGRKIDRSFAGVRVVTATQLRATYDTLFSWRGGIFVYGAILSLLAFLILAWERAGGLSREEKQELGILKAIGWEIPEVLLLKLSESFFISVQATLMGLLLAYLHVFVFQAPLFKPFLIGWSVLYPDYNLAVYLEAGSLLSIFALSIIPYLAATLIPAWRGAVTDPAEVMRNAS